MTREKSAYLEARTSHSAIDKAIHLEGIHVEALDSERSFDREPRTLELVRSTERAQLVLLAGDGAGRVHRVGVEPIVIGRALAADVRIEREDVSRSHARLTRDELGQFVIEDLASRNGTRVNGVPVQRQVLRFGDKIQVGTHHVLVLTHHDRIDEQLGQLHKLEAVGQLAAGLAHDFGNLLAAVQGNVIYLTERLAEITADRDTHESLSDIAQAVERGAELTRRLLDIGRRRPPEAQILELRDSAQEMLSLLRLSVDNDLRVACDVSSGTRVLADPTALGQIIMNLCINARDALMSVADGRERMLRLTTHDLHLTNSNADLVPFLEPGSYVALVVEDNGCGMSEETRRRIFEPFFTTKSDTNGTGLGLSTVYGLVRDHGGHVAVDSRLGEGTRFTVLLPKAGGPRDARATRSDLLSVVAPAAPAACNAAYSEAPSLHAAGSSASLDDDEPLTVVLLDPRDGVHGETARAVRRAGFRLVHAVAGVEATKVIVETTDDSVGVVIVDDSTPIVEAEITLRRLRQLRPDVPVLLLIGKASDDWAETLLALGAEATLRRPCTSSRLRSVLSELIHTRTS